MAEKEIDNQEVDQEEQYTHWFKTGKAAGRKEAAQDVLKEAQERFCLRQDDTAKLLRTLAEKIAKANE